MIKRTLVAAAATVLVALAATPALAQTSGSTSISGVGNGQAVTGTVNVHGSASADAGSNVRHLEIAIDGSVKKSEDYDGLKESASLDYSWNTTAGRNGEYSVTVSANFAGGGSDSTTYKVKVDNAPSSPTGVSASLSGSTVTISWNANGESDITGYLVERDSGNGWNSLGRVNGTSMSDSPGAGNHSYRVTALRYSPTQGEKASAPSGADSVNIAGASSGGDGSGSDSGSGSGGYYSGDSGDNSGSGGYYNGGSGSGGYYSGGGKGNNNDGLDLPGYNYGGGGKGKDGKNGGAGFDYGSWGFGGGWGSLNPGHLTLPGTGNGLSASAQEGLDWGSYEETLPYDLDAVGGTTPEEFLGGGPEASRWDYTVIPPDGLRWVAAGLWFIVAAALLKFLERKLAVSEVAAAAGVSEGKGVSGMAKAVRKVSLRELLSDDPIETPSTKTIVETHKDGDGVSFKTSAKKERKLKVVKDDAA